MKLTKYEHACFVVEKDRQALVIDPGAFTTDFIAPSHLTGIILTHQHADHFDPTTLTHLLDTHPDVMVIAPQDVVELLPADTRTHSAVPGETYSVGTFSLRFFGGEHALIHATLPRPQNLGIVIDDLIYYPGDSLVLPHVPVHTLALPVTAPWLTIGEVMDFLLAIRPKQAFPTHDAIASSTGKALVDRMLTTFAEVHNISYQRLSTPLDL